MLENASTLPLLHATNGKALFGIVAWRRRGNDSIKQKNVLKIVKDLCKCITYGPQRLLHSTLWKHFLAWWFFP